MWLWVLLVGRDCRLQVVLPQGAGSLPGFPSSFDKADVFRMSINPAFLPFAKKISGGVSVEKPWSTKDLKFLQAQLVIPWRSIGISFGITHFGNNEYNQNRLELSAGKRLGKINLGVGLKYGQTVFLGYGKENQLELCAGIFMELNEETSYFNIVRVGYGKNKDGSRVEQVINGIEYRVSDQVCIGIAAIRNKGSGMIYQFNCIYQPVHQIDLDMGMITGISTVYISVKCKLKNIAVRSGFRFGQFIGVVPAMGVMYGRESE
jgi:hypothetical protein